MLKSFRFVAVAAALAITAACQTPQDEAASGDGVTTADTGADSGSGTVGTGGAGTGIPSLVNVNLENVLNNLSVALDIDRANIPVNAQVPIEVAANVCGVSVSVLSVSTGGQASCTATTTSAELAQVVQQQIAAGGDVGGGDQTTGGVTSNQN